MASVQEDVWLAENLEKCSQYVLIGALNSGEAFASTCQHHIHRWINSCKRLQLLLSHISLMWLVWESH